MHLHDLFLFHIRLHANSILFSADFKSHMMVFLNIPYILIGWAIKVIVLILAKLNTS